MNRKTLDKAVGEAKRFLEKVEELGDREACDDIHNVFYGCRETGAVKRASLDLTNALADLRKTDAYSN